MPQRRNPGRFGLSHWSRQGVRCMTTPTQNPMTRDEVVALRGLRLPPAALKALQRAGIYCQPAISIEFQQSSQQYLIRGVESGGAVSQIGAYCGFLDGSAGPLSTHHPVTAIGVNGLHAAVGSTCLVRVQMFRSDTAYELLVTRHGLAAVEDKLRPKLHNSIMFHGKHGTLEMELWGKDRHLQEMVAPVFYNRSGEQIAAPDQFHDAILRVTAGVCCCGCRHTHLLNSGNLLTDWRQINAG
jgi:hypothetical protein